MDTFDRVIESLILVGVWLELGVGVFVAYLTWKMTQARAKAQMKRRFTLLMKKIGIGLLLFAFVPYDVQNYSVGNVCYYTIKLDGLLQGVFG